MTTICTGGIAFAIYGLATFLGFMNNGPGGDYEDAKVVVGEVAGFSAAFARPQTLDTTRVMAVRRRTVNK